ncbi:MAG: amidohydrolase [Bacillota bacterium]
MTVKASTAARWIDDHRDALIAIANDIWGYAELALHEDRSAARLAEALRAEGFKVATGTGGMPTAFVAEWKSGASAAGVRGRKAGDTGAGGMGTGGGPVIGFLGEYDALGGVSQKVSPVQEPVVEGGAGHGCGHNLLGVGALGAAISLARELEARKLPGTVRFYGCPAEENLSGKAFMARDGVFDDGDACLTWHPGATTRVSTASSLANNACNVTFKGRSAHASGNPFEGRSALDAVQLMNMGVEFLREHMPPKARVHYVITHGGDQPNVVPARATVWYMVRSPQRAEVDELYQRVLDCAEGAAKMTGTTYEVELVKAIWNVLNNRTLEDVLDAAMRRVGPPAFTAADLEFARRVAESFRPDQKETYLQRQELSPEDLKALRTQVINDTIVARPVTPKDPGGSTDVGDVSWCAPTAQFDAACLALGTPGHSWQYCAQAGMGIGHAGMLTAAKVLAEAGFELMTDPATLKKARAEFRELTGGRRYRSAMPPGQKPAFHQFAAE